MPVRFVFCILLVFKICFVILHLVHIFEEQFSPRDAQNNNIHVQYTQYVCCQSPRSFPETHCMNSHNVTLMNATVTLTISRTALTSLLCSASSLGCQSVTARICEGNCRPGGKYSLPPGLWLTSPVSWLPSTGISSGTLRSVIEYRLPLPFLLPCDRRMDGHRAIASTALA